MAILRVAATIALGASMMAPALAQKADTYKISIDGRERTYLALPVSTGGEPAPLLLLLHGSGRDAQSIFGPWQGLAKKERVVLVAPNSLNRAGWSRASEGPDFFRQVIDDVIKRGGVDTRRMYVFGHSAGGHHGIDLALLESEYFAAAAVHAGVLMEPREVLGMADRKIPIGLWNGVNDRVVPIEAARSTENTLKSAGFPVLLNAIPGHTHDYYAKAASINEEAWAMLKTARLSAEPKFKTYSIR